MALRGLLCDCGSLIGWLGDIAIGLLPGQSGGYLAGYVGD